jgi:quercetin dioxygenase-like cupin family protein
MHVNTSDIKPTEPEPDVLERTLLKPEDTKHHNLVVKHFTAKRGGTVHFADQNVEYQHYIVSGCGMWSYGNRYLHTDTAIFVPGTRGKHAITAAGESELHLLTHIYKLPKKPFRWAKARAFHLYQSSYVNTGITTAYQLITEEQHAVMGAYRMHALDVQLTPPNNALPAHTNPEETMYFLRGEGEALSEDIRHKVRPGSFIYTPVDVQHGIYNTHNSIPLEYLVVEYIEHDKAWTERGYQTPSLTHQKSENYL